jgi:hypothetical protein
MSTQLANLAETKQGGSRRAPPARGHFLTWDDEQSRQAGYFLSFWEDKYLMITFLYFSKSGKFR